MKANLPLDADRLWADVMALAEITDPERPYTRRSFSALFLEGRAWLAQRFAEAGLTARIDAAGNLIGRIAGADPKLGVIAIGSHSDTVPSGGRFDGIAGVAAGLEIVRALRDSRARLDHTIEVIDFLAEEPSEYGLSCVGSRGMIGSLDGVMLDLTEPKGEKLRDALRRVGGDPDRLNEAKRDDIRAFLELHIEQGVVLESQSIDVGVVTSIVGIRRIEIVFEGEADHAGTTPMAVRRDALVAAAHTVCSVRRAADEARRRGPGLFRRDRRRSDGRAFGVKRCAGAVPACHRCASDESGAHETIRGDRGSREFGSCGGGEGRARIVRDFVGWSAGCVRSGFARGVTRGRARFGSERDRYSKRSRSRCRVHEPHLPVRHGVHAMPKWQESRAGGMGGPRSDRGRSGGHSPSGQGSR